MFSYMYTYVIKAKGRYLSRNKTETDTGVLFSILGIHIWFVTFILINKCEDMITRTAVLINLCRNQTHTCCITDREL